MQQYLINPDGNPLNYSYAQLATITKRCFRMYNLAFGADLADPLPTSEPAGEFIEGKKVIGWQPKEFFSSNINHVARAVHGCVYNIYRTKFHSLFMLEDVLVHELGHNFSLRHVESRYSIMSDWKYFQTWQRGLFWREDFITLTGYFNGGSATPINVIFADELMRVMIPAIDINGVDYWAELKWLNNSAQEFAFLKGGPVKDDLRFLDPCEFKNNILTLKRVYSPDFMYDNLQLEWIGNNRLRLVA